MELKPKIKLKDFYFYENLHHFIVDYKSELEDLNEYIDKKLGMLDEKQEDIRVFIETLKGTYEKFGPSEEVDTYYYDNLEKCVIPRDRRLIDFFKKIFEIEDKFRG